VVYIHVAGRRPFAPFVSGSGLVIFFTHQLLHTSWAYPHSGFSQISFASHFA